MIGYSAGSAFPREGFTMHKDWSADPYSFVVSNTDQTNITSEDDVITFWYRVKDDAAAGHYPVTVTLSDAVNAAGEKLRRRPQKSMCGSPRTANSRPRIPRSS